MSTHAASQLIWGPGALLERTCLARRLAGSGAERGLPAAELLSAVSLVVAGRDQGGVSRSRQHRRTLRPRGAQPLVRDPAAERGVAEILRQAQHASRLHPVQRVPARPLRVPVLLVQRRSHLRSHHPAQQRRPYHLGKRGRRVFAVQSAQGQPDAAAGADVSKAVPVRPDGASAASQRPAVPAELSARQLARLFVLGYRARSVKAGARAALARLAPVPFPIRFSNSREDFLKSSLRAKRSNPASFAAKWIASLRSQ